MSLPAFTTSHISTGEADVFQSHTERRTPEGLEAASTLTHCQDNGAYTAAAATLLPQWLRILSPSPWSLVMKNHQETAISCQMQQNRLAASWAVAKLGEIKMADADTTTYSELSRATLIHWQLGLLEDGKPRRVADRKNDALFPSAWYVVRTLEDTAVAVTPMLLSDLAKHLSWLATRSSNSSWSEATAVGAGASGGILLRDNRLVTLARKRLSKLIARQSSEGWFPENSRFDLIKQAQVIGVLGQLFHAYGWTELEGPLRRAVEFLSCIVALETNGPTSCPPMADALLFPHGFELLAKQMPEAARIVNSCRGLAATMAVSTGGILSDALAAQAGGDMLSAAVTAAKPSELANPNIQTNTANKVAIHCEAGLATVCYDQYSAVFATKQSGAWQAHWKNINQTIFDPPIAVVQATGRLRTTCNEHVTITTSQKGRFEVVGFFSDSKEKKTRYHCVKHKLRRDGFRRVLTFLDDEIRVHDEVWCALPCQAVLLQFANTDSVANSLGSAHLLPQTPLIIHGGRGVVVERVYKSGKLIHIRRQETPSL